MKKRSKLLSLLLAIFLIATFISVSVLTVSAAGASEGCGDGNHYSIKNTVVESVAPTCTQPGYDKAQCLICGEKFTVKEHEAKGTRCTRSSAARA